MSTPHTPPDPLEPSPTPEPQAPPPEDWLYTRAAPLLGLAIGVGSLAGVVAGQFKDIPSGVLVLIGILLGLRVTGKLR